MQPSHTSDDTVDANLHTAVWNRMQALAELLLALGV